jgi:hypothetical protein
MGGVKDHDRQVIAIDHFGKAGDGDYLDTE